MVTIGFLVYEQIDLLDLTGPFEVFSLVEKFTGEEKFRLHTIGSSCQKIKTRGGMSIGVDYTFNDSPKIDILVLPGGPGVYSLSEETETMNWVKRVHEETKYTLTVCSGIYFLAKNGYLKNERVTTHHGDFETLQNIEPSVIIEKNKKYCHSGKIISSAGISSGINMALYAVSKLLDENDAEKIRQWMEYNWS